MGGDPHRPGLAFWTRTQRRPQGTPCLIPYEELPEEERTYDRQTALETLKLIEHLGFEIRKR